MPRQERQQQQQQGRQRRPLQHREFPTQDTENSIPFYNARLFSMYESLIQSYTHFTYHANHMYHVLEQVLHGTRNSINSNPYPWLIIPHPQPQSQQPPTQQQPPPQQQPQQPQSHQPQPQQPQPQQPQPQSQQPQQQSHQQYSRYPNNPTNQTPPPSAPPPSFETNVMNALFGMMNAPEERRLTSEQLLERVEPIVFGNIVNPINNVCSITHDVFEPTQRVSRIRHCGHIFNSDSLAHWLHMNNTCPTCRHNLLTDAAPRRQEPEINIGSLYNELLRTSRNIPGFEFNSVNDDSIVFSFDLLRGATGSGSTGSGATGARTRRTYDDVD